MEHIIKSTCGECHGLCGVLVHVKDGRAIKIEGDEECPITRGTMCAKGLAALQRLYHPDRLKYPLKRAGKRGGGKWERISWDEALDTIGAKLTKIRDEYSPLSIAVLFGTGRMHAAYVQRFCGILGTPNRGSACNVCFSPRLGTGRITFGRPIMMDAENSKCLLAWGTNIHHTNESGDKAYQFIEGLKTGSKLISIDPLFTALAAKADLWLQIRPGTDAALALAMLNVIINEKLYDKKFIDKWVYGFDKLVEHVTEYTPEWAEGITWIPALKIREAARLFATTKPACVFPGVAVEFGVNTTSTHRALWFLAAVTGNVDVSGGNVFWESPLKNLCTINPEGYDLRWSPQDFISPEAFEQRCGSEFKMFKYGVPTPSHSVYHATLTGKPYPIKAHIIWSCNPLLCHEGAYDLAYQAIKAVEFSFGVDHFMTPSLEMCDIVLPACTWLERDGMNFYRAGAVTGLVGIEHKAVEPFGESKSDQEIVLLITQKMGLNYGFDSIAQMHDKFLEPSGLSWEKVKDINWLYEPHRPLKHEKGQLRRDGLPGFNTPSGKIELISHEMEEMGYDSLPKYVEPPESPVANPGLAQEYPLILTTGLRSPVLFHSEHRQSPWLREIHPDPLVRIHPETAEKLGIKDGEWVYIESPRGRCKQRAKLFLGVDPRVVMAEHCWWYPERKDAEHGVWESNINLLTSGEPPYDPGFGSTPGRSLLCKVYK